MRMAYNDFNKKQMSEYKLTCGKSSTRYDLVLTPILRNNSTYGPLFSQYKYLFDGTEKTAIYFYKIWMIQTFFNKKIIYISE